MAPWRGDRRRLLDSHQPRVERELHAWLYEAHTRDQRGDRTASDALIDVYQKRPEIMDRLSAIAQAAELAWLDVLTPKGAGTAALTRQVADREVTRFKPALAGGSTDPLEEVLIGRIAAAWLAAQYADKHLADGLAAGGMPWAQMEHRARHAERMGRQFLRATDALARVRRLRFGAVQVNIADDRSTWRNERTNPHNPHTQKRRGAQGSRGDRRAPAAEAR